MSGERPDITLPDDDSSEADRVRAAYLTAQSLSAVLETNARDTSDLIVVLNAEHLVCHSNRSAFDLLGRGERIEGRDATELVDSLSREPLTAAIERANRLGPQNVEVSFGEPALALEMVVCSIPMGGQLWSTLTARKKPIAHTVEQKLAELNRRYDEKVRELAALTGKLRELATTDALTNLFNRRAFLDRAEVEWVRSRRHGLPLGCVVFDIDFFKRVNDEHGHGTGDDVIRLVGSLLRTTVRASDIPARLGGEEFVALLPQTTTAGAALLADRVRSRVGATSVKSAAGKIVRATISAGVSSSEMGHGSFSELLAAADGALYEAKGAGRDCVRVAPVKVPATP